MVTFHYICSQHEAKNMMAPAYASLVAPQSFLVRSRQPPQFSDKRFLRSKNYTNWAPRKSRVVDIRYSVAKLAQGVWLDKMGADRKLKECRFTSMKPVNQIPVWGPIALGPVLDSRP